MDTYTLHRGTAPLLISLPHDGSTIPAELAARMTASARRAPDTDWHVSKLYAFARDLGASVLVPEYSRYVVDLNRPPDDTSLYPGQNTTGLCPAVQFTGEAVYLEGQTPAADEVAARVERYWRPYHDALRGELERLHARHSRVVLWRTRSSTCRSGRRGCSHCCPRFLEFASRAELHIRKKKPTWNSGPAFGAREW